jgi:hypothetical protein
VSLVLLIVAAACGDGREKVPRIVAVLDPADRRFGTVDVVDASPDASLAVRVLRGDPGDGPPLIGSVVAQDGVLRFTPRYRPMGPAVYEVRLSQSGSAPVVQRFELGAEPIPAATTRIVGVYPSGDRIPENLLKWHIEFSAPMSVGEAYRRIRLLDDRGREVPKAFLVVDEELWSTDRRRLTLLFDPGRVKRGIRSNLEMGAPLVAGRRYALVIDRDWRDGRGAPLVGGYRREFTAAPADRSAPDQTRWRIAAPRVGTREPLALVFGEPLDHVLASELIGVVDPSGHRLNGVARLRGQDAQWVFEPASAWASGGHTILIAQALEDLAGNNLRGAFDRDQMKGDSLQQPLAGPIRVRFTPSGNRKNSELGRLADLPSS